MTYSAKTIICDEIFDENSQPSEEEVQEYAVRIGINPDTEKHLLHIALDGLMSPLPVGWKACLDDRIKRIYYYNTKTQQTQWPHPLDEHFRNLVKKKRQEESISAGDDDSKTSLKEDLKSFEEAVTTSEIYSSKIVSNNHNSQSDKKNIVHEMSSESRKVLGPLGRPPLPPKRRMSPASLKQGNLGLRLSPSPSASRIDIDSIGVPLVIASAESKPEKQQMPRSPALKLSGGGSAFLKSNQKLTPSPSEEAKSILEDPLFQIIKEAESVVLSDDNVDDKSSDERKLKHSASLGPSGFDVLTKSKRFASLQDSLHSLKSEMEKSSKFSKSPSGLKGILRDKPSFTAKLWDADPLLPPSNEKEKLITHELKEEKKQNVRFADIINKPFHIQFSKSDSDEESNSNYSSGDLDDILLENTGFDDDMVETKISDRRTHIQSKFEKDNIKTGGPTIMKSDTNLPNKMESHHNLVSRLTNIIIDSEKNIPDKKKKILVETDNNNSEDSIWHTETDVIINHSCQTNEDGTKSVVDNVKLKVDNDNNTINKIHLRDNSEKDRNKYLSINDNKILESKDGMEESCVQDESSNIVSSTGVNKELKRTKLRHEVNLDKVFEGLRDSIVVAYNPDKSESSGSDEGEIMAMSPVGGKVHRPYKDEEITTIVEKQRRNLQNKKKSLQLEFEESVEEIRKEFKRQESIERQRLYMEVQEGVEQYKRKLEVEKDERETQLRIEFDEQLQGLETIINQDKDIKVKQLREDCEAYLKEQEVELKNKVSQFEQEMKLKIEQCSLELDKVAMDIKQKKEQEIMRLEDESKKKIEEARQQIELEALEQEKAFKRELSIVEADHNRVLGEKKQALVKLKCDQDIELASLRSRQDESMQVIKEQHLQVVKNLEEQLNQKKEALIKKHNEKMDSLNAQLNKLPDTGDATQINREFEQIRCEKRLLEDKYKSLKEKYLRLKNEVRLALERKRQAKLNKQLQKREPMSMAEDSTDLSTNPSKLPLARKKLSATLSSDETTRETQRTSIKAKNIKQWTKPSVSSAIVESNKEIPIKPKNVQNPSLRPQREGVSSTEDSHTSVSEDILTHQDNSGENWTLSALSPLENLRKQLEKLDDFEEKFPTSVHTDTYLRYPFTKPGVSCELEFYRHRLHLEHESVRQAKQALSEERAKIENRQIQLCHRQRKDTLSQEERELTDMELSLHRTRSLLGEKIIRLRYLEQCIERAATRTPDQDTLHTNSSGFSGSDLDLSHGETDGVWANSILQSLENINSEIREIWTILGKKQPPGTGASPIINYEIKAKGDLYTLAPYRATDIAERTRRLKEWLIRTKGQQQMHIIAPSIL